MKRGTASSPDPRLEAILTTLRRHARPSSLKGMARYGIETRHALGVSMPVLRSLGLRYGPDHSLALGLWRTRIHEARILASLVDDPAAVTDAQMDRWVAVLDSWDLCDQCCANLFAWTDDPERKAVAWSRDRRPFVKRAAFSLIARLAVSDRGRKDRSFEQLLRVVVRNANDERNTVRKAASWAIRQIGKRNVRLHAAAIRSARILAGRPDPGARWIGNDVLRELLSVSVRRRLALRGESGKSRVRRIRRVTEKE